MAYQEQNQEFQSFATVEEFLVADPGPKSAEIYIDYQLAEGKLGTEEAEKLVQAGYRNIYLASGFDAVDLPSFFKGRIGKRPPIA